MKEQIYTLTLTLFLCATVWSVANAKKPNIVVFLADDFGYASTNAYGADKKYVRTPHIDRLAKEGIKFTDANTPGSLCSPTRYAFLTGRYAWRGKLKYGVLNPPEGPLLIEDELLTLPEFLQQQGYQTAHIGKWHLGYTNLPNVDDLSAQPLVPGPRSLGFDYHFAVPNQIDWLPKVYIENESIWGLRSKGRSSYGKSFYRGLPYHGYDAPQRVTTEVTQDLSKAARDWIFKAVRSNPDKPFFLYFAAIAVHHPIAPSERWRGSSGIGAYGDFIHDLDHSVGEIMDALAYSGVLDDTLVIFTSDNGGDYCPEEQQGRALGFENNGHLKGDKHTIWEGGVKVPFVARWPGKIEEGSETDQMINLVDLYSTFQELTTGEVLDPKEAAADSFSFYSTLVGKDSEQSRPTMIVNDSAGMIAIRMGKWKYIEGKVFQPNRNDREPQLYNLEDDPSEESNVIEAHPKVVQQMQKALEEIRAKGSERLASK